MTAEPRRDDERAPEAVMDSQGVARLEAADVEEPLPSDFLQADETLLGDSIELTEPDRDDTFDA